MDSTRPYCVLAKKDGDAYARWFVRILPGVYKQWPELSETVEASSLTPVRLDHHRYVGDPSAIVEVWQERGKRGEPS